MSEFVGQFLIQDGQISRPQDFKRRELGHGYYLDTAPDLPVVPVRSGEKTSAFLLGWPLDLEGGTLLGAGDTLALGAAPGPEEHSLAEAVLERCAGSFVLVCISPGGIQLYLDACGTLSVVFDPERKCAGSTALLLLGSEYDARFQRGLYRDFEVPADGWFSAGLTAHQGIFRLLANQCLDFRDMSARRHWPLALPAYSDAPDSVVREIGGEIAQSISAIAQRRQISVALTGGFETRAMLACCRELAGSLRFVTVELPRTARDVALARKIASLAGLEHSILPCIKATSEEAERWTRLAGHCLTGANRVYHPSVRPLAGQVLIGGLGGEVGRGFLWPADMPDRAQIDATFLVDRLKLPRHRLLLERIDQWLSELPPNLDAYQLLDLAYVELRMSCWAFAQSYADMTKTDLHPLISRRQFRRMWSLPPDFRRSGGLMRRLVESHWPELLAVPINAYGDWRDSAELLLMALREPSRAYGKARQFLRKIV